MIQVKKSRFSGFRQGIPLLDKRKESATIVPRIRPAAPNAAAVAL